MRNVNGMSLATADTICSLVINTSLLRDYELASGFPLASIWGEAQRLGWVWILGQRTKARV